MLSLRGEQEYMYAKQIRGWQKLPSFFRLCSYVITLFRADLAENARFSNTKKWRICRRFETF